MPEYFKIGKLVATFGFRGELVLKHSLRKRTSLKGIRHIFIEEKKDSFIPWFVEQVRIKDEDEVILKIEGLDTRETAAKLKTKEVWLTAEDMQKFTARTAPLKMLGYLVIDSGKTLGAIREIVEQVHQLLCKVDIEGKEALIPLNEHTLLKIDHRKKQVHVQLPEGLLDIYR
ncbi:MAG TPA: ribosome maturation factor RimM [Chitinophagaceae bacterium]|nr:ribosome maturation factor RimM [Chitinophagaceae bacterium]